jgi:hypothetical protein
MAGQVLDCASTLKEIGGWYTLALLIYPVTTILTLGLSTLFGASSCERSFSDLLPIILFGFVVSLLKNIAKNSRGAVTSHHASKHWG